MLWRRLTHVAAITVDAMRRRMVNTAGAARLARVKPATIRKWSERGTLKGHRVHDGSRVHKVYDVDDVLHAEKRHRDHGGGSCAGRHGASQ